MPIQVNIVALDRPLTKKEQMVMLQVLPQVRKERLLNMRDDEMRQQPLCAYWILHQMLRKLYGWDRFPEVALGSTGKPYFPEYPHIYFNVSHTSGAVIAAVGDVPVGVDVEQIRPVSQRLLDRLSCDDLPEDFFCRWVQQESLVKCRGTGIGEILRGNIREAADETYYPLSVFPGYAAGLTVKGKGSVQEIRQLIWNRDFAAEVAASAGKD